MRSVPERRAAAVAASPSLRSGWGRRDQPFVLLIPAKS
jgi:hypothetical protein